METANQIVNLVLKVIITLVGCAGLMVMLYSMTILHNKIEFWALSGLLSFVLTIFTLLSARKGSTDTNSLIDEPLPNLHTLPMPKPPEAPSEPK